MPRSPVVRYSLNEQRQATKTLTMAEMKLFPPRLPTTVYTSLAPVGGGETRPVHLWNRTSSSGVIGKPKTLFSQTSHAAQVARDLNAGRDLNRRGFSMAWMMVGRFMPCLPAPHP